MHLEVVSDAMEVALHLFTTPSLNPSCLVVKPHTRTSGIRIWYATWYATVSGMQSGIYESGIQPHLWSDAPFSSLEKKRRYTLVW